MTPPPPSGAIEAGAEAWIPGHWWLEVSNGLMMAERRGRIAVDQVDHGMIQLQALPLSGVEATAEQVPGRIFALARKHGLTIYEAAYLDLARRRAAILATSDDQLVKAAKMEKVPTA